MSRYPRRSQRLLHATYATPRRRVYAGLAVVTAALLAAFAATFGANAGSVRAHSASSSLNRVSSSNYGPALPLLPMDVRALARFTESGQSLHDVSLIGTRGGQAYYRIENSSGGACYAVGPVHATQYRLGQILCSDDFPSASKPVLDFTVVHGGSADVTRDRVWRSEGIAADGVASIAFRTPEGRTVGATPVIDNIYSVRSVPTERVTTLVAKDASGSVIHSARIAR